MSTPVSKRALFTTGAFPAGATVGALALLSQRASADTPFTSFAFKATGAPTPRTMPDRLAEVKNVKDFGAVGNGIADDSGPINAAIQACSHAGGGTVYFPIGTYTVTSTIVCPTPAGNVCMALRGAGGGLESDYAKIIGSIGGAYIIDTTVSSKYGISLIENLHITNNSAVAGSGGILFGSGIVGGIRDCRIEVKNGVGISSAHEGGGFNVDSCQLSGDGPGASGAGGTTTSIGIFCQQSTIKNCRITFLGTGIRCKNVATNIVGCAFEKNNIGIVVGLDEFAKGDIQQAATITGNSFESNNTGVLLSLAAGVHFAGNYLSAFTSAGFGNLGAGCIDGIRIGILHNSVFLGNVLTGHYTGAVINAPGDLSLDNVLFIGCKCLNSNGAGSTWIFPTTNNATSLYKCIQCNVDATITFSNLQIVPPADRFIHDDFELSDAAGVANPVTLSALVSYVGGTGVITITTSGPHGFVPGDLFNLSSVTGTGADLSTLNNTWAAAAGTDSSTRTLVTILATGLRITTVTGGTILNPPKIGSAVTAGSGPWKAKVRWNGRYWTVVGI
jgi:hypothetical protein